MEEANINRMPMAARIAAAAGVVANADESARARSIALEGKE